MLKTQSHRLWDSFHIVVLIVNTTTKQYCCKIVQENCVLCVLAANNFCLHSSLISHEQILRLLYNPMYTISILILVIRMFEINHKIRTWILWLQIHFPLYRVQYEKSKCYLHLKTPEWYLSVLRFDSSSTPSYICVNVYYEICLTF